MMKLVPQNGKKLTMRRQQQQLTYKLVLKTREYTEMITLAKELGMTNMRQYVKYCMTAILEAHKEEIKLGYSVEVC